MAAEINFLYYRGKEKYPVYKCVSNSLIERDDVLIEEAFKQGYNDYIILAPNANIIKELKPIPNPEVQINNKYICYCYFTKENECGGDTQTIRYQDYGYYNRSDFFNDNNFEFYFLKLLEFISSNNKEMILVPYVKEKGIRENIKIYRHLKQCLSFNLELDKYWNIIIKLEKS